MKKILRTPQAFRLLLLLALATAGSSQMEQPYFSLTSGRTFGSNGKPAINVTTSGITSLRFRVYRINDPEQFFRQLENPANFNDWVPTDHFGRHSMIERFHRWKSGLRADIRRSMRAQFTDAPSNHFTALSRGPAQPAPSKGTQYAEVPVINPQQLVLSFAQAFQSKRFFQQDTVEVPVKEKGVYVVEAVNGGLRAYTLLLISDTVMITKDDGGKILSFVVDRNTGQALPHVRVVALAKDTTLEETETDADGVAQLHPASSWSDEVRVLAHNGRDVAASLLPGGGFGSEAGRWTGYIYTDRPIYRPGHTVHFKGIVRIKTDDGYQVPEGKTVKVEINDPDQKPVYQRTQIPSRRTARFATI